MKSRELLVQHEDNIVIISINRPQKKNALNRRAIYELIATVEAATHNPSIKVVVITGVAEYFTAGVDLKQIEEYKQPEDYYRGANYVLRALVKTFIACTKLLVCLINGPCIGIGFTLAALCDAVYCTKDAFFQTPFSQLGICAEACSSWTFPRHFGPHWSTNLLIFGEKLLPAKAEQLGFVLQVFENSLEVEAQFWPKIREYAQLPEKSLLITKRLMRMRNESDMIKVLDEELKEIEKLRRGPAHRQAVESFLQKSFNTNKSKL